MSQKTKLIFIVYIIALVGLGVGGLVISLTSHKATADTRQSPAAFATSTPDPRNAVPRFDQANTCVFPINPAMIVGKDVRCGVVVVPELHSKPDGLQLRLAVIVYKRQGGPSPADAIIFLEGGPGGSSDGFAHRMARNSFYTTFTAKHDVIIFDQRGVNHSDPALNCPTSTPTPTPSAGKIPVPTATPLSNADWALNCGEHLQQLGINLAAFNTAEDAADVNDIRAALGYAKLAVYGVSYGTLLAQVLMRDHPEAVRDVVLDSVVPLGVDPTADVNVTFDRALKLLFATCFAEATCRDNYPTLADEFSSVVAELNDEPIRVPESDLVSGKRYTARVSGDRLVRELQQGMYSTSFLGSLPKLIDDVYNGDYSLLSSMLSGDLTSRNSISRGTYYAVQCADQIRPLTEQQLKGKLDGVLPEVAQAIQSNEPEMQQICASWPGSDYHQPPLQPLHSNLPTLILSGDFDPITPPAYSRQVAHNLSNSYYVPLSASSHASALSDACAFSLMAKFLDNPTKPDSSCASHQRINFVY